VEGRRAIIFLAAALAALAFAPAAHATLSFSTSVDFTVTPITVGSSANATISFTNNSDGLQGGNTSTVDNIFLDPSCDDAGASPPCMNPETGVFSIGNGTGAAGTVCAGDTFTVGPAPVPFTGSLEFSRQGGDLDMVVNQTCLINFTYTALRVPTVDGQPGEPGVDTNQDLMVRVFNPQNFDSPVPFGPATDFTAVAPAPATSTPPPPALVAAAGPTGQQAAALAKCKKKRGKARKKCKKKALLLPV
jgi:hypothetical protein